MKREQKVNQFILDNPTINTKEEGFELFNKKYPEVDIKAFNYFFNRIKSGKQIVDMSDISSNKSTLLITTKPVHAVQSYNKEFEATTLNLDSIDPSLLQTLATGTAFDKLASGYNGLMKATVNMITGESGAGKTTICTNIAEYIKQQDPSISCGFISAEMDINDWTIECLSNRNLANLETIFLLDYLDATNYVEILKEALGKWKYVVVDSFEVIIDQLKELKGWTSKKAESELIKMLRQAAFENHSCLMVIQQYTKGGTFVGSNKIKHLTTAMIYVMFDEVGDRYLVFTKNRRGGHMVGKRLYYTKNKTTGMLQFDEKRLNNKLKIEEHSSEEMERIKEDENYFENVLLEKAAKNAEQRDAIIRGDDQMTKLVIAPKSEQQLA